MGIEPNKMTFLVDTDKFSNKVPYLELDQWRTVLPVTGRVSHAMDDTPTKNMHVVGYLYHHQLTLVFFYVQLIGQHWSSVKPAKKERHQMKT